MSKQEWTEADSKQFREILQSYATYVANQTTASVYDRNYLENHHEEKVRRETYPCRTYSIAELDEETKRKYGLE